MKGTINDTITGFLNSGFQTERIMPSVPNFYRYLMVLSNWKKHEEAEVPHSKIIYLHSYLSRVLSVAGSSLSLIKLSKVGILI